MNYITPGITKIDFEDNIFVTTELDKGLGKYRKGTNEEVVAFIGEKGGIVKNSVAKNTNYLIYREEEDESAKYKKALELIEKEKLPITVLPLSLFKIVCRGEGIMDFGTYRVKKGEKPVPIRWNILCRQGGKALLLSAYGLECKPYHKKSQKVTWETCTLRQWLNEDFYNAAFSEEEKNRILLTKLHTEDDPDYHTSGGNDTEDRVFLLSKTEAAQYLTQYERRITKTSFAFAQDSFSGWGSDWWLRSPGCDPTCADHVGTDGQIPKGGYYVNTKWNSVCPAMWVELE